MGWFITQSLLFIIVPAIIFFLIGLWVGWILWARRNKATGKHTAETVEKKSTASTAAKTRSAKTGTAKADTAKAGAAAKADSAKAGATKTGAAAKAGSAKAGSAKAGTAAEDGAAKTGAATRSGAAAASAASAETKAADADGAPDTDTKTADDAEAPSGETDASAPAATPLAAPAGDVKTDTAENTADAGTAADASTGSPAKKTTAKKTTEPSDIEDENLAVYAGAEAEVVAEAEAATRDAAVDGETPVGTDGSTIGAALTGAAAGTAAAAVVGSDQDAGAEDDDLTRIEGVGPKIAAALQAGGYGSYAEVAEASEDDIRKALADSGIKFAPAAMSFAAQAQYLVEGDEEGLEEYQDYLIAGRERRSADFVEDVDYTDVDEVEGEAAKQAALAADAEKAAEATGEDVDTDTVAVDAATAGDAAGEPEAAVAPEQPADENLKVIEGIGPKIEKALKADGITSYAQIAATSEADLRASIRKSGIKFAPSVKTWAEQAQYLVDGDGEGLGEYQDYLIGGQERGTTKFVDEVDYTDVDEVEGEAAKQAALAADAQKVAEAEGGKA